MNYGLKQKDCFNLLLTSFQVNTPSPCSSKGLAHGTTSALLQTKIYFVWVWHVTDFKDFSQSYCLSQSMSVQELSWYLLKSRVVCIGNFNLIVVPVLIGVT